MGNSLKNIVDLTGFQLTPLKIIDVSGGDVMHALKASDHGFVDFGEAYFSMIEPKVIKAWKRHQVMTLNLIVPIGKIRFVIYDDRIGSTSSHRFQEITLSKENYLRLTVPPMVWIGFQGIASDTNMLLNIADIEHRPDEVDRVAINEINYEWDR